MNLFRWLKGLFSKGKGPLEPSPEDLVRDFDEPDTLSEAENRLKVLQMQIENKLRRKVSVLEILDIEKRLIRTGEWEMGKTTLRRKGKIFHGIQGEIMVQAERFSQSWYEMVSQLKGYSLEELKQHLPMPGMDVTYARCIKRTIEELQDELRHLDGLLAEMPRWCKHGLDEEDN